MTADPMDSIKKAAGIVETTKPRPKNRSELKGLLTYHRPAVIRQLKLICAEQDMNQQQLLKEALNMLFVRYQKEPIA